MITTPELEAQGLAVRVTHVRRIKDVPTDVNVRPVFAAKGGFTQVQIVNDDGETVAEGVALCSMKENYDRRKGRTIALGRAMKALKQAS